MRDIKFRAWDKNAKEMKYVMMLSRRFEETMHLHTVGFLHKHPISPTSVEFIPVHKEDNFVTMQYIGLKDKNGREIYENDICKQVFFGDTIIGIIEYDSYGAQYGIRNKEGLWPIIKETIEILGNVHENQELLERLGLGHDQKRTYTKSN